MTDLDQRKLKLIIQELENIRGSHTELVSVYVPAGYNLLKVVEQIAGEKSTAMNIKSKSTRNNVISALEKILAHLRAYRETPKNGLAVFCGNISKIEGADDIEIWGIEPPDPIQQKLYRCDKEFILDPLKDAFREKEVYGMIVFDASEATIGFIRGKKVVPVKHMDSMVPGKFKAGGWSANRFARVREGLLNDWLKNIAKIANEIFLNEKDLKGVILAGPGPTKDFFAKEEYLTAEVRNKVLGVVDTAYSGDYGMQEALERGESLLSEASIVKEKKLMERFFAELGKDTGLAMYGLKEIAKALDSGVVDTVLISEDFDWVEVELKCSCGHSDKKVIRRSKLSLKCPNCGQSLHAVEADLLNKVIEVAEKNQTKVEMISPDSAYGEQLKGLGGIAAILRFKVN